ncbi:MAG: hypothetical protein HY331_09300 [Chloroflexi bacterium]|nr:hypothetical protein [Chloroflexota bacterium]
MEQRFRLQIVIAPDCHGCEEARALAAEMQAHFPHLRVELFEMDGSRLVPPGVVATPTYLLDGKVVSLGNPRREDLMREIERSLARRRTGVVDKDHTTRSRATRR